jgi:hypothetical protein
MLLHYEVQDASLCPDQAIFNLIKMGTAATAILMVEASHVKSVFVIVLKIWKRKPPGIYIDTNLAW